MMRACHVSLLIALGCSAAEGAPTYRCTSAGRTAYQSAPCADGIKLDNADSRTETQVEQGQAATKRQILAADQLQAANLAREQARNGVGRNRTANREAKTTLPATPGPDDKRKDAAVNGSPGKSKPVFTVKIPAGTPGKTSKEITKRSN